MPIFIKGYARAGKLVKSYFRGTLRGSAATIQKQGSLLKRIGKTFDKSVAKASESRKYSLQKRYFKVQTFGSRYKITHKG